jgi:sarcosine oxidase / L-pipecolate oxidase
VIRKSRNLPSGLRLTLNSPDGNFLIDYHPSCDGLFIATGGSGHAFKFFPVIGDKVLAAIERRLDPKLKDLWAWRTKAVEDFIGTDDGSRAGREGMLLDKEMSMPRL